MNVISNLTLKPCYQILLHFEQQEVESRDGFLHRVMLAVIAMRFPDGVNMTIHPVEAAT